jgi:GTP-binding protein
MGERLALVDSTPGLTRDRREGITHLFNIPIRLVDTAGYEGTTND